MTQSNEQQNMEQTQNPTVEQQSTTNQKQQNRRIRTGKHFLVSFVEKLYSDNISIDTINKNTRLKN